VRQVVAEQFPGDAGLQLEFAPVTGLDELAGQFGGDQPAQCAGIGQRVVAATVGALAACGSSPASESRASMERPSSVAIA